MSAGAQVSGPSYYGPEFLAVARSSVDAMKMHHYTLARISELDAAPPFVDAMAHMAPARLHYDDGSSAAGKVSRIGLSGGGGWGAPRTGGSFFAGANADIAFADAHGGAGNAATVGEFLLHMGAAFHGFFLTAGALNTGYVRGFDQDGFFMGDTRPDYRPGTPLEISNAGPRSASSTGAWSTFVSFRAPVGLTLGGLFGTRDAEDSTDELEQAAARLGARSADAAVRAVRAELTAEALLAARDLRERWGLPSVSLEHYGRGIDYWGDNLRDARRALGDIRAAAQDADQITMVTPTAPVWEIPLNYQDILGTGISVKATTQVSPSPLFRQASVAWDGSILPDGNDALRLAARAQTFRRGDEQEFSAEAAVDVRLPEEFNYIYVIGLLFDKPCRASFSYSYNRPDAALFFPIPDQHVFGVQWTVGEERMRRPIVQLSKPAAKAEADQ